MILSSYPLCPGQHTCYNGRDRGEWNIENISSVLLRQRRPAGSDPMPWEATNTHKGQRRHGRRRHARVSKCSAVEWWRAATQVSECARRWRAAAMDCGLTRRYGVVMRCSGRQRHGHAGRRWHVRLSRPAAGRSSRRAWWRRRGVAGSDDRGTWGGGGTGGHAGRRQGGQTIRHGGGGGEGCGERGRERKLGSQLIG